MIFIILFIPKNVQAVGLQANKGGESLVNTDLQVFFDSIRQMEDEHGTLGTKETDNGNGIDCHMTKNTEWVTAAMLSASRYGIIPSNSDDEKTTTGNKSGIYQMAIEGNKEYVVSRRENSTSSLKNVAKKYVNIYVWGESKITGDLNGYLNCSFKNLNESYCWYRGMNLISVGKSYVSGSDFSSRAAVVCGSGL